MSVAKRDTSLLSYIAGKLAVAPLYMLKWLFVLINSGGERALSHAIQRPLEECEQSPCYANKEEKCGGKGRMLVYKYDCRPVL